MSNTKMKLDRTCLESLAEHLPTAIAHRGGYVQTKHGYQNGFVVAKKRPCPCITTRTSACNQIFIIELTATMQYINVPLPPCVRRYIVDNMPAIIHGKGGVADVFSYKIVPISGSIMCMTTRIDVSQSVWFIELKDMEQENKFCIVEDSEGKKYKLRIRKLTPKECLRLMDVRDEDADKMLEVNSKSQVYKQAGNSIVVACMEKIFHNLFIDPQPERKVVRMRQIPMF